MVTEARRLIQRKYAQSPKGIETRRRLERERYARSPAKRAADKNAALKHRTGWTYAAKEHALKEQYGVCAICPRELGVGANCDHCHKTKRPRALLCRACNLGLGYYEKWQRPAGLVIDPYDDYLARW